MKRKYIALALAVTLFVGMAQASVLSVDKLAYQGNSEFFQGDVFVITMTADQSTEDIVASETITSDELSQAIEDGETVQDVTISLGDTSYQAVYPLSSNPTIRDAVPTKPIKSPEVYETKEDAREWASNNCYDLDGDGTVSGDSVRNPVLDVGLTNYKSYRVYCVGQESGAGEWRTADIQTVPDEEFVTTITVDATGKEPVSKQISNSDITEGKTVELSDNIRVRWLGNLDTGVAVPSADSEIAIHNGLQGGWRVVDEAQYREYHQTLEGFDDQLLKWAGGTASKSILEQELDTKYQDAISKADHSDISEATAQGGFDNGILELDLESQPSYPQFVAHIKAGEDAFNYINIRRTAGQPEILEDQIGTVEISKGETTTIDVPVRNTGDAVGEFSPSISQCDDPVTARSPNSKQVEPGQIETFTFEITGSQVDIGEEKDTIETTCEFTVTDETSQESVSSSFTANYQPDATCTEGNTFIESETEDGEIVSETVFEWTENCNKEEVKVCEGDQPFATQDSQGNWVCTGDKDERSEVVNPCEKELVGGLISYTDPLCEAQRSAGITGDFTASTTDIARLFFSALAGLVAFGLGRGKGSDFARIEDGRTRTVIGMFFGVLGFIILWSLWQNPLAWIALIVGGLLYIGVGRYFVKAFRFVANTD